MPIKKLNIIRYTELRVLPACLKEQFRLEPNKYNHKHVQTAVGHRRLPHTLLPLLLLFLLFLRLSLPHRLCMLQQSSDLSCIRLAAPCRQTLHTKSGPLLMSFDVSRE